MYPIKKILSSVLAAAVILSLLSSCSGISTHKPPKEPVTITLWHYYNGPQQDAFDSLVQEFNDTVGTEKGIIVDAMAQGNVGQLTEAILDASRKNAGAGEIPDIFAAYADTAFAVDELGLVATLDQYLTPQELDAYMPGYIEEGRFDHSGSLKIFPVAKSTEIMFINETDWNKFAAATGASLQDISTIEGLTKTAEIYYNWTDSLTLAPNDGKAFYGRDSMANYMLIGCRQLGIELLQVADGKVTINLDRTAMKKLWDNFYVPYVNGYFVHFGRFRSDDIKTGDIIAQVGSTSGAAYFPNKIVADDNSSYDITTTVMEAPEFADSSAYAVQQGAGMVVTKSTPEIEAASVEFLKWFTRDENNLKFSLTAGYLPVTKNSSTLSAFSGFMSANKDSAITQKMAGALETAIKTVEHNQMYTNRAFKNGTAARNVLENSMIKRAKSDSSQVQVLVDSGMSRADAAKKFTGNDNFISWLDSLEHDLNAAISL